MSRSVRKGRTIGGWGGGAGVECVGWLCGLIEGTERVRLRHAKLGPSGSIAPGYAPPFFACGQNFFPFPTTTAKAADGMPCCLA